MSISVVRLRRWMLAGAALLVVVVAAYLIVRGRLQKWGIQKALGDLHKLGIDVVEETNDYTVSQTGGPNGKPLWTIHASKAIHYKNDMITLQNASIVLYGRKQDREDHISGAEFEYDKKNGIVQAAGEVHIDLQAPMGNKPGTSGKESAHDDKIIHIRTTGLIFKKDLGIAATSNPLDFQIKGITGSAVGAEYNSDTGLLILESQVRAAGLASGRPVQLAASHAEFNRIGQRAVLQHATYQGTRPGVTTPEKVSADDAILLFRPDGTPQHIDASGNVTLQPAAGRTLHTAKLAVDLSAGGQPQTAHAFGGLQYSGDEPLRKAEASANEARIWFDEHGLAQRMVSTGQVRLNQRTRRSATAPWTTRTFSGNQVEANFVPVANSKQVAISEAHANGAARVVLQSVTAASPAATTTTMTADRMDTTLPNTPDGLGHLHGEGRAVLLQVSSTGAQQENHGDSMDVSFHAAEKPSTAKPAAANPASADALAGIVNATLQGHVTIAETPARKPTDTKPPVPGHGSASRAEYDAAQDRLTLIDNAQWASAGRTIWAGRISTNRTTGDAEAQGGVKASIVKDGAPPAAEATHVVADRARILQATQTAQFYGSPAMPVRMWQGGSHVEAPVLILEQAQQRLTARGDGPGMQVHAVFSNTKSDKAGKRMPSVTNVAAHEMTYSDATRQGSFTGGVQMDAGTGTVTAEQGTVFLQPAAAKSSSTATAAVRPADGVQASLFSGDVDRVVASGRVRITQPGRHGSGEQLVYTAAGQQYVLTGSAANPPTLSDSRGTTTGVSLIFHADDDSVEISGGPAGTSRQDVHTETRIKPRKGQQ